MNTIVVVPDLAHKHRGTLHYADLVFPCVLGRGGVSASKHEGDGATPIGAYPLRRVLYRADRLSPPQTALPVGIIARDDGWCDAPDSPDYNRPVKHPSTFSAEHMWRDDGLYDVVVVIGHNDDPVVAGAGSAIFMHVAPESGEGTAGCVALKRDDLLTLLGRIQADTKIDVRA